MDYFNSYWMLWGLCWICSKSHLCKYLAYVTRIHLSFFFMRIGKHILSLVSISSVLVKRGRDDFLISSGVNSISKFTQTVWHIMFTWFLFERHAWQEIAIKIFILVFVYVWNLYVYFLNFLLGLFLLFSKDFYRTF